MTLFQWEAFVNTVAAAKYDTKELGTEYNPYIDSVLKEFGVFSRRLAREVKQFSIPKDVQNVIWEQAISLAMEQLVEGFSRVKKVVKILCVLTSFSSVKQ